jgi:oligopeptide/dipeptide ABC transporter ATP-binding protein
MSAPLLSVYELGIEVGGKQLLTRVSLDIPRGASVGVVGETGSGKTVTCRFITGLIRRSGGRVTGGSARFADVDLVALDERAWRRIRGRRIALVPQSSMSGLNPVMRIDRQLRETVRELDPAADPQARAGELLDLVHMAERDEVMRRYPHELSGGMRQRVMIALALAGRPELLVADEATTALDVTVQRSILELLTELRTETGMSLAFVTHDLALVHSTSDEVVIMYAGMVVERGAVATVLRRPAHPYTRALLAARPELVRRGEPLQTIPGAPPIPDERPGGCPFSSRCPLAVDRCRVEVPPLDPVAPAQSAACWRAEEVLAA